jgi:hypothetical protein
MSKSHLPGFTADASLNRIIRHYRKVAPGPMSDDGNVLMQGDYVTTQGGLLTSGDDQGARVYWFVNMTAVHGNIHNTSGNHPPFSHTDPDFWFTMDSCPP